MSEWKTYKLSEILNLISGGTPKTTNPDFWNGNIPWLSIVDFGNANKYVYKAEKSITEEGLKKSSTNILKKGQIIISARGTVGALAVLDRDMAFNQSCYGINANDLTSNEFLYYLLKDSIQKIQQNTHGAVFDTITRNTFDHIEVTIPPKAEQQKIASILSSLDDKIELNNQMNQTLEQIAQAIFKEWFVDFNFPGFDGNLVDGLPKGWRKESIDKNINYLNGLALQKYPVEDGEDYLPVIKIRELRQGVTSATDKANFSVPENYIIKNGDILFSWSGSLDIAIWNYGTGALNQHLFKVSSNTYPKWFYYFWTKHFLPIYRNIAASKATTMGHIQRRHLTESLINVPDEKILKKADEVIKPLFDRLLNNAVQCSDLAEIRNNLLSKLLNGNIKPTL